ncbi:hypothetical protein M3J09_004706 [Ascochyta lentis]
MRSARRAARSLRAPKSKCAGTAKKHQITSKRDWDRKFALSFNGTGGLTMLPQGLRRWLRSAKREELDVQPLARLQNPESQAVYASYMVRFVCFYLRILAVEEQRIVRFREQQDATAYAESHAVSGREEDSEENSVDADGISEADSDGPQSRRTTRSQTQQDMVKDACWLFYVGRGAEVVWDQAMRRARRR